MKFRDFTIEIRSGGKDYLDIDISACSFGDFKTTILKERVAAMYQLVGFRDKTGHVERGEREKKIPKVKADSVIGQKLFEVLFSTDQINQALGSCMTATKEAKAGIRFKLILNPQDQAVAEMARLPWELLHDKRNYVGLRPDTSIVRYLKVPKQINSVDFQPPLRILVVSSNPRNDLDLEREQRNLKLAVGDNRKIELAFLENASIGVLKRKLRSGAGYHILHYMGHGDFVEEKGGVLLLNKEGGGVDAVDAKTFNYVLQEDPALQLVFLNACHSAQSGEPFSGVATALVFEGVPAVVAMQHAIPDQAAIILAKCFYENIAEGVSVDSSLSVSRREVRVSRRGDLDWAIPVLFMRSPDGALFPFRDSASSNEQLEVPTPEQLGIIFSTDDPPDQVEITTAPFSGQGGLVRVCLEVDTESGWWKGIGLNERDPTVEGEKKNGRRYTTISPGVVTIHFWKAKLFGVHTHVGSRTLDLSTYKDHEVVFSWKKD